MTSWEKFYADILDAIKEINETKSLIPFFRGEDNNETPLVPSLFKPGIDSGSENNLYLEFEAYSALFFSHDYQPTNSWEVLFEMRHHGLQTRLLDWTGSFAVALYFALNGKNVKNPCIWILDPIELNKKSIDYPRIISVGYNNPKLDYMEIFLRDPQIDKDILDLRKRFVNPIAIYPIKTHARLLAQDGHFTVHGSSTKPINEIYPACVKRYDIPESAIPDAKQFLKMANMNEFTLFPDLDGLCRHLKKKYSEIKAAP